MRDNDESASLVFKTNYSKCICLWPNALAQSEVSVNQMLVFWNLSGNDRYAHITTHKSQKGERTV